MSESALFLESSALSRRYNRDTGSAWVESLLVSGAAIYISALASVEVTAAIARRGKSLLHAERAGAANKAHRRATQAMDQFELDLRAFRIVPVNAQVIAVARDIARTGCVRGCDAVQLATAWLVHRTLWQAGGAPLLFISADADLNAAAASAALELRVDNPDDHAGSR